MTSLGGARVAIVSRIFTPEPAAAALRLAAVAQALTDAGAEVTVITTTVPGSPDARSTSKSVAHAIRRAPALRDRNGYIRGYLNYLSFDIPAFFRLIFSRRFDTVLVEPPPTTGVLMRAATWLRRTPYVFYAADVWSEAALVAGTPKGVVSVVRWFERWVYLGAFQVLSVSESVTRRVQETAPKATVATIGNGYDDSVFRLEGPRVNRARYLLYAGTASEVHGAGVFISAMQLVLKAMPDAQLVFIGHGADWDRLQAAASRLPAGSVTFLSRISPSDTAKWIRGAHATLASVSIGGYEAFPTKMYASAGCGTPVVYSGDGEGTAFVRDHDAGWFVDDDPRAAASAMIEALSAEPTESRRRDLAARTRQAFSLSAVGTKVAEVIATAALRS